MKDKDMFKDIDIQNVLDRIEPVGKPVVMELGPRGVSQSETSFIRVCNRLGVFVCEEEKVKRYFTASGHSERAENGEEMKIADREKSDAIEDLGNNAEVVIFLRALFVNLDCILDLKSGKMKVLEWAENLPLRLENELMSVTCLGYKSEKGFILELRGVSFLMKIMNYVRDCNHGYQFNTPLGLKINKTSTDSFIIWQDSMG